MKMPTDAIREEILKCGVIPFARFMELALYCPETGYYERNQDNVGRRGDFITSVSVGSLFGELLAFQFAEWLTEIIIQNEPLKIIEAGAHDGRLAGDILNWLQKFRPELFAEIEYCILEPSPARRQWQQARLKPFANVRWITSLRDPQLTGILFSNELLDAFPVRRLGWEAKGKKWFEWGVALDGEKFAWARLERRLPAGDSASPPPAGRMPALQLPSAILNLPSSLLDILPDGYIVEDSPAAANWWREAAQSLKRGKLLAIDYGYTADEQISPARLKGTLRAYQRHQVGDDLLAQPGEQDLTAHVNFSAIQAAGEETGLKTDAFCTQPQFLTRILSRAVKEEHFTSLDPKQIRQFQTLTHPEHLGRAFRVLLQSR